MSLVGDPRVWEGETRGCMEATREPGLWDERCPVAQPYSYFPQPSSSFSLSPPPPPGAPPVSHTLRLSLSSSHSLSLSLTSTLTSELERNTENCVMVFPCADAQTSVLRLFDTPESGSAWPSRDVQERSGPIPRAHGRRRRVNERRRVMA